MLGRLPAGTGRPAYDRARIVAGVAHIGVGAFHRAHQAAWFDEILSLGDPRWGVQGVSLRSPSAERALRPQDGLYTLVERSADGETARVRGAIKGVITAGGREREAVAALAAAELVTLTITEKGYAPETAEAPTTAAGLLARALDQRRVAGLAPFTVLACDNLDDNGARIRALVLEAAARIGPALANWIEQNGAFPSTMVDRITPAMTPEENAVLEAQLGYRDDAIVTAEHFRQWVIEDRFAGPRPDFAAVGVQVVADVAAWQTAKLRLLNAAHSALAYLGALAGFPYVHEAIGWPPLRAYVRRLWSETASTLDADPRPRSRSLSGSAAQTVRQPASSPSAGPDRHGRLAETAPAPPGHDPGQVERRPVDRRPCPRRSGLGPLAARHRRSGRAVHGRGPPRRRPGASPERRKHGR